MFEHLDISKLVSRFGMPLYGLSRWHIVNKRWFATMWLIVTTVFLGLVLLALQVRNSDAAKAAQAAGQFLAAVQANDTDTAYAMGGMAFHASVTEDNLRLMIDRIGPYLRQADIEQYDRLVPGDTNDGGTITLVYKASRSKSQAYLKLVMVNEAGDWRLYGVQASAHELKAGQ